MRTPACVKMESDWVAVIAVSGMDGGGSGYVDSNFTLEDSSPRGRERRRHNKRERRGLDRENGEVSPLIDR